MKFHECYYANDRHHGGSDRVIINGTEKKFVGICDDHEHCNIPPPPPTCGEAQKDGNEMPWLVSLGGYSDGLGDISHWDHQCAGSLVTQTCINFSFMFIINKI